MTEGTCLRVYYAAGLFNEGERNFNLKVKAMLDELGCETWFPQVDAGFLEQYMEQGMTLPDARHAIFDLNLTAIRQSDVLVFNLDGRVPDEGAAIEAGVAFGWGKKLIGIQTDFRMVEPGGNNLMIDGILNYETANSIEALRELLTTSATINLRDDDIAVDLRDTARTYVAVTGPLGAGKTTLIDVMRRHGGWQALEEPVDENPYLDEVYARPEDLAFRMQVYYLSRRTHQHRSLNSITGRVVQERCILDDGEVFFGAYHAMGAYNGNDLATLMDMYRGLLPGLELPSRIVAVAAPFEVCMDRVASRAREGEQHLNESLARKIYDGYQSWWDELGDMVIHIDTAEMDLVESPSDRAAALAQITAAVEDAPADSARSR